ncbi:MAG: hypothetical protein ACPGLV_09270, partial [Bacteroidia bacterium]
MTTFGKPKDDCVLIRFIFLIEIVTAALIINLIIGRNQTKSSLPSFQFTGDQQFDYLKTTIEILLIATLIVRIFRILKKVFKPKNIQNPSIDSIIFVAYLALVSTDIWVFSCWYYFTGLYLHIVVLLLLPLLFGINSFYASIKFTSGFKHWQKMVLTLTTFIICVLILSTALAYTKNQELNNRAINGFIQPQAFGLTPCYQI